MSQNINLDKLNVSISYYNFIISNNALFKSIYILDEETQNSYENTYSNLIKIQKLIIHKDFLTAYDILDNNKFPNNQISVVRNVIDYYKNNPDIEYDVSYGLDKIKNAEKINNIENSFPAYIINNIITSIQNHFQILELDNKNHYEVIYDKLKKIDIFINDSYKQISDTLNSYIIFSKGQLDDIKSDISITLEKEVNLLSEILNSATKSINSQIDMIIPSNNNKLQLDTELVEYQKQLKDTVEKTKLTILEQTQYLNNRSNNLTNEIKSLNLKFNFKNILTTVLCSLVISCIIIFTLFYYYGNKYFIPEKLQEYEQSYQQIQALNEIMKTWTSEQKAQWQNLITQPK